MPATAFLVSMTQLSGVFPILATPFADDGSPSLKDLARLIDFIVAAGPDGLVFPGVASEVETLAPGERESLVEAVAAHLAGRLPLVIGVSAPAATDSVRYAQQAKRVGAAAVMAMAPAAMKDDTESLRAFYRDLAAVGVPIILQSAPPPVGGGLSPQAVLAIVCEVPGIAYVKEETMPCGQRISQLLDAKPATLRGVFGGAGGRYITDELARGACGTMPACELIDLHVRQFALHRAGDADGVRTLFDRMLPLLNFQAVFRMAMTKEVLRRRGVISAIHVRATGPRLDAGDQRELTAMLTRLADLIPLPDASP
jgi:4-hydroxy-tetrahydrodipicolinate synthase